MFRVKTGVDLGLAGCIDSMELPCSSAAALQVRLAISRRPIMWLMLPFAVWLVAVIALWSSQVGFSVGSWKASDWSLCRDAHASVRLPRSLGKTDGRVVCSAASSCVVHPDHAV